MSSTPEFDTGHKNTEVIQYPFTQLALNGLAHINRPQEQAPVESPETSANPEVEDSSQEE